MKYLITGPTGFIGPHLIRKLISSGHSCRCLVRHSSDVSKLESLEFERVNGDITKPNTLKGIADDIDCVLHLATLGHMSNYKVSDSMFERINVHGTINVMQEALRAGVPKIVHCSTVAAMGICEDIPATEKSKCQPHHPYGLSKLNAERKVLQMVHDNNLPAVIVRFSMVYGPGDWRDMLKLTRLAKKGMFPKIGSKPKLTPLIHVADAVEGMLLSAQKGRIGETYLITNDQSEPFDQIRLILQQALGVKRFPLYIPERLALAIAFFIEKTFLSIGRQPPFTRKNIESTLADRVFSIDKAKTELGFSPKIDPVEGLTETVHWYMENEWV